MLELIIQIQNTILLFGLGSLKDTLCSFSNVNHDLNTHISILTIGLLIPNFACKVLEYFPDHVPFGIITALMVAC